MGYQTPGKRAGGGAIRGHILLKLVPVSRSKIGTP
ncbi:polymorphic toxin type 47 domain-containing protein [Pseudomonas orientalis]